MRLSKTHLILKVGIAACAMGVVVLAFAGCDKPQPSREVFSPRVVGPPWPDQETMPLPAAGTPVPAPILAIQWRSVDAYCMARAGNWPPLHLVMGNIRAAASDLPLQRDTVAVREPEMRNTIHKLDDAIAVHDRLGAMLYANQIYRLAVEMEVPYRPVTPVELAMLSYYTREIEVWCGMRDLAHLRKTVTEMQATWNDFRMVLRSRNVAQPTARFDESMNRLQHAATVRDYYDQFRPMCQELREIRKAVVHDPPAEPAFDED